MILNCFADLQETEVKFCVHSLLILNTFTEYSNLYPIQHTLRFQLKQSHSWKKIALIESPMPLQ